MTDQPTIAIKTVTIVKSFQPFLATNVWLLPGATIHQNWNQLFQENDPNPLNAQIHRFLTLHICLFLWSLKRFFRNRPYQQIYY